MFTLLEDDESGTSISAALGVSKGLFYRYLKRVDLFVPSAKPLPQVMERYHRIRTLFEGLSTHGDSAERVVVEGEPYLTLNQSIICHR